MDYTLVYETRARAGTVVHAKQTRTELRSHALGTFIIACSFFARAGSSLVTSRGMPAVNLCKALRELRKNMKTFVIAV